MDATDEAYLLMSSTFMVREKREPEMVYAPIIIIALVFVFVFFGLLFEVRRIVHIEQVNGIRFLGSQIEFHRNSKIEEKIFLKP